MKISNIVIRKHYETGRLKAIVSVTFDDSFVVHDIKIIDGPQGVFIAMPSRRKGDHKYIDIVHPINSEFREYLSDAILDEYEASLATIQAEEKDEVVSAVAESARTIPFTRPAADAEQAVVTGQVADDLGTISLEQG